MFFAKTDSQPTVNPQNIGILGTSADALWWANQLQNAGHNIRLLTRPQQADEYNATDFVFRDTSRLRNQRGNFRFIHELDEIPHLLIIASSPDKLKADLSLLAPGKLADTLTINFCFLGNGPVLTEILRRPPVSAYHAGCFNGSKNHITVFKRAARIVFSIEDTTADAALLREIFEPTNIKPVFSADNMNNFWSFAGPFLAHNMLTAAYGQNIFELAKEENGRKTIDTLLEELSKIAAADNVILSAAALLSELYEIPQDFNSPLQTSIRDHTPLFFDRLSSFLLSKSGKNERKYPMTHRLLQMVYNKY